MNIFKGLFGSKKNKSETKISNQTDDKKAMNYLVKVLEEKEIVSEVINDCVILSVSKLSIKVWIGSETKHPNAVVCQLNFVIAQELFSGEIVESLVGIGENADKAVENGVNSFFSGVLVTILEAFDDTHNEKIDFQTEWNGKTLIWHPKIGPLQIQGKNDFSKADENKIYNSIKEEIKVRLGNKRFYWIKVFVARQANGEIITQCSFNNEAFYPAQEKMESYAKSWNNSEFKSEKQYIIIRQCDKTWTKPKYSQEDILGITQKTIELIEKCKTDFDYDNLFERMCELTMDRNLAFELYCFIPEVYCRIVVPQARYSDEIIISMVDGTRKSMYLSQFATYSYIKKCVLEKAKLEADKGKIQKVICLSSNFDAISQALNKGSKPENLITGPLMLNPPESYFPVE